MNGVLYFGIPSFVLEIERLSYDLEKVFALCSTDQCLARLKQSFSLLPPRELLIWPVNSSIAQSHYCISNDVKAKLSRKFHGGMTLFASAFAKPMKIRACLFLFDKPIKCCAFCSVTRSVQVFAKKLMTSKARQMTVINHNIENISENIGWVSFKLGTVTYIK